MHEKVTLSDGWLQMQRDLAGAFDWLRQLGLDPGRSRFSRQEMLCRDLVDAQARGDRKTLERLARRLEDPRRLASYATDCQELILVRNWLSNQPSAELCPRLKRYMRGAEFESQENTATGTNEARNIGYELVTAAEFAAAGMIVRLPSQGDIDATLPGISGTTIHVEAKRPQSPRRLRASVSEAAKQLAARMCESSKLNVGLISISIGKLVRGDQMLLPDTKSQGLQILDHMTRSFVEEHRACWQTLRYPHVHLVHVNLSMPLYIRATHRWSRGVFGFFLGIERSFNSRQHEEVIRRMVELLRRVEDVGGPSNVNSGLEYPADHA